MRMAGTCYSYSKMFIMILIIIMTSGSINPVDATRVSITGFTAEAKNERDWCVAKAGTPDQSLIDILHYLCDVMHTDCNPIAPGGLCYPDTLRNHASFAMNRYYQTRGHNLWDCNFNGNGLIVFTDPSYGICTYNQF